MPVLSLPDLDLWWEEHGSGPPLMLVAGLGGTGSYWTPNLPALAARFRVILHDQRGTGRSSRTPVRSVGQMAGDARALMDHLGLECSAWLGHSTGAAIGADLALDTPHRISRLMLYASTTHGTPYRRRLFAIRRALQAHVGPLAYAQFTSVLLYPPWYIDANAAALETDEAAAASALGSPDVQASRLDAILAWDRRDELALLAMPVQVACAADDILTPIAFSEDFCARIPGAALVRWPTGGHAASRTVPRAFEQAALDFFGASRPSPTSGRAA